MSGLNLVPNEVVGYRIVANTYSWDVVLVKRKGEQSKNSGEEYVTSLAYCKNLTFAVNWILNKVLSEESQKLQAQMDETGDMASLKAILQSFEAAQKAAGAAVQDLESRIKSSGLELKDLKNLPTISASSEIMDGTEESRELKEENAHDEVSEILAEIPPAEAP